MNKWSNVYKMDKIIPVNVPDGKSGDWYIETFVVSEKDAEWSKLRAAISFSSAGRWVPAGTYKYLKRKDGWHEVTVMSNTPDEIVDQYPFFHEAKGRVLINGLGLGVSLDVILNKVDEKGNPVVTEVFVVEKSPDVLKLVKPTFEHDKRVKFVLADALEFKSVGRFDAVWHDIWDYICGDNLETMKKLHRKYGRKTDWQGSWCREQCERNR